jgi:hypothetical protein
VKRLLVLLFLGLIEGVSKSTIASLGLSVLKHPLLNFQLLHRVVCGLDAQTDAALLRSI